MIRLIVTFGSWLDKRFPEKIVVKATDYVALVSKVDAQDNELSMLRDELKDAKNSIEILVNRVGSVESKSAHVDAVRDIINKVVLITNEVSSLKASLGMNRIAQTQPSAEAFLNGSPIGEDHGE